MAFLSYIILGLIQGITEFLPVSSSGHLVLAQYILGVKSPGIVLEVALHLATVLAVLVYFRRRLADMFRRSAGGGGWLRFLALVIVASIPAAILGVAFEERVEGLFETPATLGWSFLFTAAVLFASAFIKRRERTVTQVGTFGALAIGLAQAVAIAPGVSRSGMTIVAGLAVGLAGEEAAAFSFLLSVPAILGAGLLELRKVEGFTGSWAGIGVGTVAAFLAGLASIYVVLALVRGRRFGWFALYCAALGVVTLVALR